MQLTDIINKPLPGLIKKQLFSIGIVSGFVDLFKTTSNLYVADGLILKGLMGYPSYDN